MLATLGTLGGLEELELDAGDFDAFRSRLSLRLVRGTIALSVVGAVVLWPTDWLVYAPSSGIPRAFVTFRVAFIAVMLAFAIALHRVRLLMQRPVHAMVAATLAGLWLVAANLAPTFVEGGAMDWFYAVYLLPFVTLTVVVPLRQRALLTFGLTAACFGLVVAYNPLMYATGYIAHPAINVVFASLAITWLGHVGYRLLRDNFEQRRALAKHADELAAVDAQHGALVSRLGRDLRAPLVEVAAALENDGDTSSAMRRLHVVMDRLRSGTWDGEEGSGEGQESASLGSRVAVRVRLSDAQASELLGDGVVIDASAVVLLCDEVRAEDADDLCVCLVGDAREGEERVAEGAVDYVVRPIDVDVLRARVASIEALAVERERLEALENDWSTACERLTEQLEIRLGCMDLLVDADAARDEERERVAAALRADLGERIAKLRQTLSARFDETASTKSRALALLRLDRQLGDLLQELSQTIRTLRAPDTPTLEDELERIRGAFERRTGATCVTSVQEAARGVDPREVAPVIERLLADLAEQGSAGVDVVVAIQGGDPGFSGAGRLTAARAAELRERILRMGGRLNVQGGADERTRVELFLP